MVEEMNYSEKQFRQMIDEIPALAWSCLPDGSGKFLNKQWLDYTGLSVESAPGLQWEAVVHPDDLENVIDTWRRHLASAEPIEVEARLRRFDGGYRWFLLRAVPLRDEQNNVIKWYGTNTDIEDRKQMETSLRRDKVELRLIIDTIPQYIIVLEPDGTLKQVNQQVLDYTGLTSDDVQAPEFRTRMLHPADWERLADERRHALAQGGPFELELRSLRKDGQYRWFLMKYNPQRDEQGRVVHWYATGTDITERKEAAEALVASENFARGQVAVLKSTLDALAKESAPDRLLGHMLRTITEQFGAHSSSVWRRDEPTGMIGFEFAFEDGRVVTRTDPRFAGMDLWLPMEDFWPWPEVFRTGKLSVIEDIRTVPPFALRDRLLPLGIVTVLLVPMLIAGRLEGAIGLRFTQKRFFRTEELELAQALANQATLAMHLTRLSAESREAAIIAERNRMARDIHDTLAQGFTGVIVQLEAAADATSKGLANEADEHVGRAADLARESLKEARRSVRALRPLALEDKGLSEALDNLLRKMTAGTTLRATFSLKGDARPLPAEWQENFLHIGQEVLTNALRHARATEFHGELVFGPDEVHLELRDNGRGFDPGIKPDGFGLIGIEERVEGMGGRITIESSIDKGTAVLIIVPLAKGR
jgi:PAS domain S-box-containing protein